MHYLNALKFENWGNRDMPLYQLSPFGDRRDGLYPACLVVQPCHDQVVLFARVGLDDYPACMDMEREIEIPPTTLAGKLRRIGNNKKVATLCIRMAAGYSKDFDGRNHGGRWSQDAERAFRELEQFIDSPQHHKQK